jgi:hypothetical protein
MKQNNFNDNEEGISAPFNMGVSTLMRLDNILRQITELSINDKIPPDLKQVMKIELVKQFYLDSVPLLKENIVRSYEWILEIKPKTVPHLRRDNSDTIKQIGVKPLFSPELDLKLNKVLCDLQIELQKEKYFMPSKRDPKFSWRSNF